MLRALLLPPFALRPLPLCRCAVLPCLPCLAACRRLSALPAAACRTVRGAFRCPGSPRWGVREALHTHATFPPSPLSDSKRSDDCLVPRRRSSNENAKRIFLCSLWYLPVMLGAMLLHKKGWKGAHAPEEEEQKAEQEAAAAGLTSGGRSLCVHEDRLAAARARRPARAPTPAPSRLEYKHWSSLQRCNRRIARHGASWAQRLFLIFDSCVLLPPCVFARARAAWLNASSQQTYVENGGEGRYNPYRYYAARPLAA